MTLPAGSHLKPDIKSAEQARKVFSNEKIKNLVKIKLQEYISSFFQNGENFNLLQAISPRAINYNTDKSFDQDTDPTQRKLQISRYFNKLRSVLPSILIADGGVTPMPDTIGQIGDAYHHEGYWYGVYPIVRKVPISVILAARDIEEADEISGILSLMFNELRNLAGGNYITGNQEEGETWVIMLPNGGVELSALSELDVQDDPIEKIWYAECQLEIFFEDKIQIRKQMPEIEMGGGVVGQADLKKTFKPEIVIPDQIPVSTSIHVLIKNFQDHYRVILSDGRLATLSHTMTLTPRRLGKFKIMVYDDNIANINDRIIAEKEVEII